ncbi:rhodanese domain-containing protein CG4456 [Stomoxys calcitrans]|uniref:rhodanese domain-containing protein CG4456 n=1 Tax=Stomoxys calcitrans TaxID=35570 RepID=UPI0027E24D64|nr:rhodanese domain-containing protein CG4456 [Stomoxys calcitrans]
MKRVYHTSTLLSIVGRRLLRAQQQQAPHNRVTKSISYALRSLAKMATYEEIKDVPNHPEVYLIDVRNKDELASTGAIPASINIPLPELEAAFKMPDNDFKTNFNRPKPTEETVLIFSCLKGGRAQKAADMAVEKGFKNAKPYPGSWTEWAQKEGL